LQAIGAPWLLYLIVLLSKYFGYEASLQKIEYVFYACVFWSALLSLLLLILAVRKWRNER
jgi:hypothetical protein